MSYDLDLRSPECKASLRLIKPRTLKLILAVMLIFCLAGALYGLGIYALTLEQEIHSLSTERAAISPLYEPLAEMEGEIEKIKDRAALEEKYLAADRTWSVYLHKIRSAAPRGLDTGEIVICAAGTIEIRGSSPSMQSTALYKQSLKDLSFTESIHLETIILNPAERYDFSIRAVITAGKGVEEDG